MKKYNKKIELKRVNMNLPLALAERVEKYAEKMNLNTTNAYVVLLNNALDQLETLSYMPMLIEALKQVGNSEKNIQDLQEMINSK